MLSWKEFNSNGDLEYIVKNRKTRQRMYQKYIMEEKMKDCIPCDVGCVAGSVCTTDGWMIAKDFYGHTHSLGTIASGLDWKNPVNKEEGNNPMNYATATVQAGTTETQDQRKYLSQRLENIYYKLEEPLFALFGLSDDHAPQTPKELKERIASGKFIINGLKDEEADDVEQYFYGGWTGMIRWRDPAKKADHDGYTAARKELQDLRQKTLDIIKIDEPKAGLEAIKALEAWTPTGAAN